MRVAVVVLLSGGLVLASLPDPVEAQNLPDMRRLVSNVVKQRWANSPPIGAKPALSPTATDPDLVKLPPFLVNAPILKVPTAADTVRAVVAAVGPVNYTRYLNQDAKRQDRMRDLIDLANLARASGDTEVSDQMRRETYRALVREPTPLERAMDRSANGGRY